MRAVAGGLDALARRGRVGHGRSRPTPAVRTFHSPSAPHGTMSKRWVVTGGPYAFRRLDTRTPKRYPPLADGRDHALEKEVSKQARMVGSKLVLALRVDPQGVSDDRHRHSRGRGGHPRRIRRYRGPHGRPLGLPAGRHRRRSRATAATASTPSGQVRVAATASCRRGDRLWRRRMPPSGQRSSGRSSRPPPRPRVPSWSWRPPTTGPQRRT